MPGEGPLRVKIEDAEVKKYLSEVIRRTGDPKPAFEIIGETVRTSIVRNFEVGGRYSEPGSPVGGTRKWKPLSLMTLYSGRKGRYVKERGGYRKGMAPDELREKRHILIKTGHLLDSINWKASRTGVAIGTNKIYGKIHNFGGKAGRGRKVNIPARPFLVYQPEDLKSIGGQLLGFLARR